VRSETINARLGANEEDGAAFACTDLCGDQFLVHWMDEHHVVIHRFNRS